MCSALVKVNENSIGCNDPFMFVCVCDNISFFRLHVKNGIFLMILDASGLRNKVFALLSVSGC